jgi:hypothetical protein
MAMRQLTKQQRHEMETDLPKAARDMADGIMRKLGELPSGALLALTPAGALIESVPLPQDFRLRTAVAEACRSTLLAEKATAYAISLEMWLRRVPKEDLDKPAGDFGAMPDSIECVMIYGQTPAGGFAVRHDIVRSADGKFHRLRLSSEQMDFSTGIWTDLLYRQQAS